MSAEETARPLETDALEEFEAEFTLESPASCPACKDEIRSLNVVRVLRTRVNFTSTVPGRGYLFLCPSCRAIVPVRV